MREPRPTKRLVRLFLLLSLSSWSFGQTSSRFPNAPDPRAFREVPAGKRTTATAASWGYDEADGAEALQSAINPGARRYRSSSPRAIRATLT